MLVNTLKIWKNGSKKEISFYKQQRLYINVWRSKKGTVGETSDLKYACQLCWKPRVQAVWYFDIFLSVFKVFY